MRDLAALLVEAGVASAADVERAAERQRERGGRLDTALLELELLPEDELAGLLCRASGLGPPPPDPIEPDPRARRLFPARVAERHGLAPFRLEGRELSVLATYPVDLAALDEISFMLSLHLVPHVAPEWRVRALMARTYGGELPGRFAALAEAVRSARSPEPAGSAVEGAFSSPTPTPTDGATAPTTEAPTAAPPPDAVPPPDFDLDDLDIALDEGFAFATATDSPGDEGAACPAQLDATAAEDAPGAQEASAPEPSAQETVAPETFAPETFAARAATVPTPAERGRPEADEPLAAALAQALSASDPEALLHDTAGLASDRDAPPHWTREDAFAALEAAQGREGVVAVALRYARDFFEAAALFAVTKERVSGQDAVGWERARERCRDLQVAPEAVGLFRAVLSTSGPYLGPVAREPGNEAMLATLGRPWPRIALVYPVALRERTVCVLYADNGDAPVSPRRLGDLLLLAGALGGALERMLRQAKRIRAVAPPLGGRLPEAEPTQPQPPAPQAGAAADRDWSVREVARLDAAAPHPADGPTEPFHVTRAEDALEAPAPFDPVEAVQRLCGTRRGSAERGRLVAQLVERGPEAAAALRAAFPGPLDLPPAQAEAAPVEERGPVLMALRALGIVATPYLAQLLFEPDAERRRIAALLLGRIRDPASFLPLADRAFDPDAGVRDAALAALARARRDLDFRPVLERLRRALLGEDPERAASAASALARLGDAEAVPLLLESLDGPGPVSEAAGGALELLTCRRFGRDAARWLAWWKEHGGQRRVDWLFAALGDGDREVRAAAAEKLREAGAPPLPWLADASPAERAEAGRAWRTWWDRRGLAV